MPTDIPVTITASPSMGLERTVELAERLTAQGYDVVPHLAARMVSGRAELTELVERLTAAGDHQRVRAGRRRADRSATTPTR